MIILLSGKGRFSVVVKTVKFSAEWSFASCPPRLSGGDRHATAAYSSSNWKPADFVIIESSVLSMI